jgi:hypothetical protein
MAVTRTPTVPNPQVVTVSPAAGEVLHFRLDAVGPIPIFAFASNVKGTLFEAPDFMGHPKTSYEWEHLRNPSDVQQLELLDLMMSFLTNGSYRYVVELQKPGTAAVTVLDIAFTGLPTDMATEGFRVVIR